MKKRIVVAAAAGALVMAWIFRDAWLPAPRLADDGAYYYDTEHYRIRVSVVAKFEEPWGLAFLPDGGMLVTEKVRGRLRLIRDGVLQPGEISGAPQVDARGQGGLLDVAVHPRYAENGFVYLTYSKTEGSQTTTALMRARFDGAALADAREIFVAQAFSPSTGHFGSRLAFDPGGMLFMTVGDRMIEPARAQDTQDHAGAILRLRDDGAVPDDNPFVTRAGFSPAIYSFGHRNPQGLAIHPESGEIFSTEHGPLGGDELNRILPGRNYGWPVITYGRNYSGTIITDETARPGMEQPLVYWVPSIAPSGLAVYTGEQFPMWKDNFFVGALANRAEGEQLVRIEYDSAAGVFHQESLLRDLRQRIRDVRMGPDGFLYVLTDAVDGALLKIEPASE